MGGMTKETHQGSIAGCWGEYWPPRFWMALNDCVFIGQTCRDVELRLYLKTLDKYNWIIPDVRGNSLNTN